MSSSKISKLGLHKWNAADPVKRTEFNENFQTIDAKLSDAVGRAIVVTGSYTGNGRYGSTGNACTLEFPDPTRTPKLLIVMPDQCESYRLIAVGGMTRAMSNDGSSSAYYQYMTWPPGKVSWYNENSPACQMNQSGTLYRYLMIG